MTIDALSISAHKQSLRGYLAQLAEVDELLTISNPVALEYELSAYLSELDGGPAILFDHVASARMPVVGNILTSRARIGRGLDVALDELDRVLVEALDRRIPPTTVESGPCQEVVAERPELAELPIPTFFEGETGPYITAGVIFASAIDSGERNVSIARLKPLGGNRAMIGIAPNHHLAMMARAAANRGALLPIAVTIGNHPAVMIASCYYLQLGEDETEVAGGLLGEPVELVACRTSDLSVPAHCELVLEGTLDPAETVPEGPVSEFHGLYEDYGSGYVVTFDALTRRRDSIYQAVEPGFHREHLLLAALPIAAGLTTEIRRGVRKVTRVAVTPGGCGRLHAVVALENPRPGEAKRAMFAAWSAVSLIKMVTVVEDDIDVHDPAEVEWSLATRFKADRDVVVVPDVIGDRADPLATNRLIPKLGLDATRSPDDRSDWRRATPPAEVTTAVRRRVSDLTGGSR